ncbi:MAG TPA: PglZ domain-containing protein, partial [Candidatus Wallbacteria bacterium]|nr:PglZ domain-containing protein [Candidatus Wallbacteria bacterium]
MKLFEYIKNEIFVPRLSKTGVLVIYDHNKRYKDICADMGSKKIKVVDASESSILGRETALKILNDFGYSRAKIEGVVIYVPAKLPITDEDKQRDPFSIYTVCGTYFPDGDGDEYMSICLKFKPDHSAEVRKIFGENNNPPFEVIDAIGGGAGWPILHALLKSSSAVEIILSLLAPS